MLAIVGAEKPFHWINFAMYRSRPEVEFLRASRLAICRPEGCLDAKAAEWLLVYVLALEESQSQPFNRLLDLRNLLEIRLSGSEVSEIARNRRHVTAGRPSFQTAMLAVNPFGYAVARLYEDLMAGSPARVAVFRDAVSTAKWLQVPLHLVKADS